MDWADARADAFAVLAALGLPMEALTTERVGEADVAYHPGRAGVIRQGPKVVLARFGALHPGVLQALGFEHAAAGFEILLDAIGPGKKRRRAAPELPALQPVRRDFAFIVAEDVAAETLMRAARAAERTLIVSVSLFDVYEGEKVPAGTKSLAIEVVLQPRERTLTDAEIESVSDAVVAAVKKATGASLRS
jgi:phenylalanyl-tRNA synthetase beta chain